MENVATGLQLLNHELLDLSRTGENRLYIEINGKPSIEVQSYDPFIYRKYGLFNPAPHIRGELLFDRFLWEEVGDESAFIWGALKRHRDDKNTYGFRFNPHDRMSRQVLNGLAAGLGHPEIQFGAMSHE